MNSGNLLGLHPTELKFPFELKKQSSCSMQLTNRTDRCVAFKIKTTNPKKYCVRPNTGVVLPGTTCDITVTMQAQMDTPPDFQCKDKFLIQSVITESETTAKDINAEMFIKGSGKSIEEFKMRVVYIPANPPSPVPEEPEEGSSPRTYTLENGLAKSLAIDAMSWSSEQPLKGDESEVSSILSKLSEEKTVAMEQNRKLQQEMESLRKDKKSNGCDSSVIVLVLAGLVGTALGYFGFPRF